VTGGTTGTNTNQDTNQNTGGTTGGSTSETSGVSPGIDTPGVVATLLRGAVEEPVSQILGESPKELGLVAAELFGSEKQASVPGPSGTKAQASTSSGSAAETLPAAKMLPETGGLGLSLLARIAVLFFIATALTGGPAAYALRSRAKRAREQTSDAAASSGGEELSLVAATASDVKKELSSAGAPSGPEELSSAAATFNSRELVSTSGSVAKDRLPDRRWHSLFMPIGITLFIGGTLLLAVAKRRRNL
jgi:hypothetical protein